MLRLYNFEKKVQTMKETEKGLVIKEKQTKKRGVGWGGGGAFSM